MLTFAPTRTRRLCVNLKELTLGQAITVAKLPPERHELTITEMLRFVAADATKPRETYETNPLLWTVEERTLLIVSYLAQVSQDGPDFPVGKLRLSSFVDLGADSTKNETDLGQVAGKARVMRPLLGAHAQALEVACTTRGEWIMGAIACQVFAKEEPVPDWAEVPEGELHEWIEARIQLLRDMPESVFEEVYLAWLGGLGHLQHFVAWTLDDAGLVYLSKPEEGGGEQSTARFLANACISDTAKQLCGRPD